MKAMILAAGLGTRLKPLTDKIPKALVEIDGEPMLKRVILYLKNRGVDYIVVNVHHFASQIIDYISANDFGVKIFVSDESRELLDTGGGIVKAMPLLFGEDRAPVLFHNVDILSNADITKIWCKCNMPGVGSSLLVSERNSTRKLVMDSNLELQGWHDLKNDRWRPNGFKTLSGWKEYSFGGIYAMTYEAIVEMKSICGTGKYSVMDYFLSPYKKERVEGVEQNDLILLDIGKPATLLQAESLLHKI